MTALTDPDRIPKPLREVVRETINRRIASSEDVASSLGLEEPGQLEAYLDGKVKVHFNFVMLFADAAKIDYALAVRHWLAETVPDLLKYLGRQPHLLLTANERRFIERVRDYTDDGDCELVLVDGGQVFGLVLAK